MGCERFGYPGTAVRPAHEDQVELLTRINTSEFLAALGFGWLRWGKRWLEALCRPAARQIALDMARFDGLFTRLNVQRAARQVLDELVGELDVCGAEGVPSTGPLLITANHPGVCDVLTILATVDREDVIVVAADYPLLRALSGINSHFLFVPSNPYQRRTALSLVIAYLRSGGAVLMLPAGEIEPDPAVDKDASLVLNAWSQSVGLIARRVANLSIVPAVVSGVLLPSFQHHPLTWIRRRKTDRQQLGTMLQVLARASRTTKVRLVYGPPLAAQSLPCQGTSARAITQTIVGCVRELMSAEDPCRQSAGIGDGFATATGRREEPLHRLPRGGRLPGLRSLRPARALQQPGRAGAPQPTRAPAGASAAPRAVREPG